MLNLTANCLFETIFALPFMLEISFSLLQKFSIST